MFCNKCGKEIESNSLYCKYCGNKINYSVEEKTKDSEKVVFENVNNNSSEESGRHGCLISVVIMISIILVGFVLLGLTANSIHNNSNGVIDTITERPINSNDYVVSTSQDLTSVLISITPNVDIKEIEVEVKILNKNGEVIYADTKSRHDLTKNKAYSFEFDFGFVNAFSANQVRYYITGTTSVFN